MTEFTKQESFKEIHRTISVLTEMNRFAQFAIFNKDDPDFGSFAGMVSARFDVLSATLMFLYDRRDILKAQMTEKELAEAIAGIMPDCSGRQL